VGLVLVYRPVANPLSNTFVHNFEKCDGCFEKCAGAEASTKVIADVDVDIEGAFVDEA
jgi:hypothetical protein